MMTKTTIQAVRIHEHGGPDVLRFEELPLPEPGPGEVRVRLTAMALNHLDLWVRRGIPGVTFPLPLIPGCDGAGRIEALGEGVAGPLPGTRVFLFPGLSCMRCPRCLDGMDNLCPSYGILGESRNGTATEAIVVPASNVAPVPEKLDWPQTAAFPLTFLTAWNMLVHKLRLVPGQKILVHAAGSGLSSAGLQMARLLGASIAATATSPEKAKLAEELGAECVVNPRERDWTKKVRAWAGPSGLDAVFDHLGEETFGPSLRLLAKGGRYVFAGATTGFEMKTDFRLVFFKNLEILGSTMGRRADLFRIAELVNDGKLRPIVDSVFPFPDMAAAHQRLESRQALGKVVVTF